MLTRIILLGSLAFLTSLSLASPQTAFDFDDMFKNAGDGAHVVHSVHEVHSDSRTPGGNWDRTIVLDNQKPEVKKEAQKKDFWDNMPSFPTLNLLRRRQVSEIADIDGADFGWNLEGGADLDLDDLDLGDLDTDDIDEGMILKRRGLSTAFDFTAATDLAFKLTEWDLSEMRDRSLALSQDDDRDFEIFRFRKLRKNDGW
ncbi:hypothetical protein BCR35DRAFT_304966 [Leucosporidium creatinivorum]|uniref:Uncharacterized protein n=1 Tax=Leucosporidium creatinivorum TaxID=106004 RepID=A0A1Y2F4Y5_9BASI|nr:hypothetical protein BCR35DRAFT_304966 [Leucosporidium creatinivorum]